MFRKKQILAARINVPISGMENAMQVAQIQSIRKFSGKRAYNSFSGPKTIKLQKQKNRNK